ncbi:MAG: nucleoside triphosphate pyrophosphohydrolase [Anaerolineaceae bacterium]|nr:nucleoside triphosphate pyrophosphohydrolase [Anaerolineaceae bacterium]
MQSNNTSSKGITILGLGPAGAGSLTLEAWQHLNAISELYLRTSFLPVAAELPQNLRLHSFDYLWEEDEAEHPVEVLVSRLIDLAKTAQGVSYAVPGSPMLAEETSRMLIERAKAEALPVRIIDGMSFIEPVCRVLGIDLSPALVLADALALGSLLVPSFSPAQAALITQITNRQLASEVKLTLMANYPDEFPVRFVHAAGTDSQEIEEIPLWQIDHSPFISALSTLYLPPREPGTSFEDFQEVIARLRAPDGCPWDREQTHLSLRQNLLEEAYEVLEALDKEDMEQLQEELGDLLLQIVLHTQIANENEDFKMSDVLAGISQKLIRRHPHVFAEVVAENAEQVVNNWEQIKAEERKNKAKEAPKGMLDGIPHALPALIQANQIQIRARRVGFDWQSFEPVIEKVREELQELLEAKTPEEKEAEAGDLLFACVNVIRWLKIDPEMALRETNARFRKRFSYIEAKAAEQGKSLQELGFEAMDALWNEAKEVFAKDEEA